MTAAAQNHAQQLTAGASCTGGVCPRCGSGRWRHEAHNVCGGCGAVTQHETREITRPGWGVTADGRVVRVLHAAQETP